MPFLCPLFRVKPENPSLSHFKSTFIPSPITMGYGVSTGSILSPIIILVYENDIGSSHLRGKHVQYADNTTLCFNGKSKEILEEQNIVDLNNWSNTSRTLILQQSVHSQAFLISLCRMYILNEGLPSNWRIPYKKKSTCLNALELTLIDG